MLQIILNRTGMGQKASLSGIWCWVGDPSLRMVWRCNNHHFVSCSSWSYVHSCGALVIRRYLELSQSHFESFSLSLDQSHSYCFWFCLSVAGGTIGQLLPCMLATVKTEGRVGPCWKWSLFWSWWLWLGTMACSSLTFVPILLLVGWGRLFIVDTLAFLTLKG